MRPLTRLSFALLPLTALAACQSYPGSTLNPALYPTRAGWNQSLHNHPHQDADRAEYSHETPVAHHVPSGGQSAQHHPHHLHVPYGVDEDFDSYRRGGYWWQKEPGEVVVREEMEEAGEEMEEAGEEMEEAVPEEEVEEEIEEVMEEEAVPDEKAGEEEPGGGAPAGAMVLRLDPRGSVYTGQRIHAALADLLKRYQRARQVMAEGSEAGAL